MELSAALRAQPIFSDLTDDQIAWLVAHGSDESYEDGDVLFAPGSEADSMTAVLEGAIEVMFSVAGQFVPYLTQRPGDVTGMLPFSRLRTYAGSGQAAGRTRLYRLHQSHFDEMLRIAPSLGPRLVALMTDRVRESTRLAQQREKMMALGKLAAGLAHEINTPAAATGRAAALLQERLQRLPALVSALITDARHDAGLPEALAAATQLARDASAPAASRQDLNGLQRSTHEDALMAWMERRDVPESWLFADTFVDAGIDPDALDRVVRAIGPETVPPLLTWLESIVAAQRLAADIRAAAGRVSELVGSVKVYSHMDRAGAREPVNVPQGIDSTLVMLGHRLKKTNIALERAYAPGLPAIDGYSGELNQVWTNLLDNAIDAMPEGGTLRVEAVRDGSAIVVRVIDSGSGISAQLQPRIFEAFFTTKPVGEGTGLGLDIVQRIVAQQHGGRVDVESRPGRTVFAVRLPIAAPH
jgi:signal transduction histidine kinase